MHIQTKKRIAGFVAAITLITSFLFWTEVIAYVVEFQASLSSFTHEDHQDPIHVRPLELPEDGQEDMPPAVRAPETTHTLQSDIGGDEPEAQPLVQTVHPAADELKQWEIQERWSLSIPSIGVRAPVLLPSMTYWQAHQWDLLEEQMQVGLAHGAVAYPHSVDPGQKGNVIIAGHSSPPDVRAEESHYGHLFARLPDVSLGETVSLLHGGNPIKYRIEKKAVVSPSQTSILQTQYDKNVLKLITCYPVGTTRDRMIIIARQIEE